MTGREDATRQLVIITGLSGAGNSTALKSLADAGMYCIDNLPMELLDSTISLYETHRIAPGLGLALGMDVRDRTFAARFPEIIKTLRASISIEVIFLTADPHVISTRFSATRRRHPLMTDGNTLTEAVDLERELLGPVEEAADVVIDTSRLTPHQLARAIEDRLENKLPGRVLHFTVTSFGFKYGQLTPTDFTFDVRYLENPYFIPELKDKTGLEAEVADFIFGHKEARDALAKMEDLIRFVIPLCYREGKQYLRLGVGCTGGKHRSVAFAEEFGRRLLATPIPNLITTILHRDIEQD